MTFFNKYKWLMPMLLFTAGLIIFRFTMAYSLAFVPLLWNLLLGAIPLYLSFLLRKAGNKKTEVILFIAWLLFFPNAMYIVTDLFHLKDRPDVPKWYDLLILISAAISGVIMGFLSLFEVERYLHRRLSEGYIRLVIFCCFMLCGYGVYLGRYLRWNSWDVVAQPVSLCSDIVRDVVHPFRNIECWSLTVLFGAWMYILYVYIKKASALHRR